jgi:hypothetical protein
MHTCQPLSFVRSGPRDPAAHAKHQVSELDKTAKKSQAQRKKCNDNIEADTKEIHHLEEQIARIKLRYDPLCEALIAAKQKKEHMMKTLAQCMQDEKGIMTETKSTVKTRMLDDSKLLKKMASLELQTLRGFTMTPESTFYQSTRKFDETGPFKASAFSSPAFSPHQKSLAKSFSTDI